MAIFNSYVSLPEGTLDAKKHVFSLNFPYNNGLFFSEDRIQHGNLKKCSFKNVADL